MPYIPKIRIGSTTYDLKDNRVDDVNASINSLVKDIAGVFENRSNVLCSKKDLTPNGYIDNTNGGIITYNNWVYTQNYINIDPTKRYSVIEAQGGRTTDMIACQDIYYAFYDSKKEFTHGGVTTAGNKLMAAQTGDCFIRVSSPVGAVKTYGVFMLVEESDVAYYTNRSFEYAKESDYRVKNQDSDIVKYQKNTVQPLAVFVNKYRHLDNIIENDGYFYFDITFDEPAYYGVYTPSGEVVCTYISSEAYNTSGDRVSHENYKLSDVLITNDFCNLVFHVACPLSAFQNGAYVCKTGDYPLDNPGRIGSAEHFSGENIIVDNEYLINGIDNALVDLCNREYVYVSFDRILYTVNGDRREYTKNNLKADLPNRRQALSDDWDDDVIWANIDPTHNGGTAKYLLFNPVRHKVTEKSTPDTGDIVLLGFINNDYKKPYGLLWDEFAKNDHLRKNTIRDSLTKDMIKQIDQKEDSVIANLTNGDFVFAYVSDDHVAEYFSSSTKTYETRQDYTNKAIDLCDKHIGFDAIVNCGDSILTTAKPMNSLRYCLELIDTSKLVYVEGNHDRNIEPEYGIIPKRDFFALMYRRYLKDSSFHFGNPFGASYFYKDYEDQKLRFVVLDLYDLPAAHDSEYNSAAGYRQEQLVWLAETALRVNSDWDVIVCTHMAPVDMQYGNATINNTLLHNLLCAFKNGTSVVLSATDTKFGDGTFTVNYTADFTNQGARSLICCLSGHNHWDAIRDVDGIKYVSIACGYLDIAMYKPDGPYWDGGSGRTERYKDTYSNIAFDICILRKTERKIYFKRIGYGQDRTLTY